MDQEYDIMQVTITKNLDVDLEKGKIPPDPDSINMINT